MSRKAAGVDVCGRQRFLIAIKSVSLQQSIWWRAWGQQDQLLERRAGYGVGKRLDQLESAGASQHR